MGARQRFPVFLAVRDDLFGYRLHVADLATDKALAAVIWAAVAKDPGYSPESLITGIRRNARYRADDYADLNLAGPMNAITDKPPPRAPRRLVPRQVAKAALQ